MLLCQGAPARALADAAGALQRLTAGDQRVCRAAFVAGGGLEVGRPLILGTFQTLMQTFTFPNNPRLDP